MLSYISDIIRFCCSRVEVINPLNVPKKEMVREMLKERQEEIEETKTRKRMRDKG